MVSNNKVTANKVGKPVSKDRGEVATLPKKKGSKKSTNTGKVIGHTVHYDLAHGTGTTIRGVKYVPLLVDKKSRNL